MLLNFENFEGSTLEESHGFVKDCTIEVGTGPAGHNCVLSSTLGDITPLDTGLLLSSGIYEGFASTSRSGVKGAYSDFSLADTDGWPLFEVWNGDWVVGVYVNGSDLEVWRVGATPLDEVLLFTATGAITPSTFARVDFKWTLSSLDVANQVASDGSVELFVDMVSVGSASGVPIGYGLPEGFTRDVQWNIVVFNPHGRGALSYLLDGNGAQNTDVLPDGLDIITGNVADGNGNYSEMTPSAGTDHGALVNETTADGDTTGLIVTGNAKKDSWLLTATAEVSPKIVRGLKHVANAKKLDSGYRRMRSFIRRNNLDQFHATDFQVGVDYLDWMQAIYELDPHTNLKFLVTDLNNSELGILVS